MFAVNGNNLSGKIGNKYVIWFGNSKNWVLFEEPAWFVYKLLAKDISPEEISVRCKKRYKLSETESKRFVNEINLNVNQLSTTSNSQKYISNKKVLSGHAPELKISHNYLINNHVIKLHFQSSALAYYFHPLLSHFESVISNDLSAEFLIYTSNKKLILQVKGNSQETYTFENIPPLKKQLFIGISNIIYNKTRSDWMSFLHASGITDGKKAVLFPADTGSGKSTLAALLMNQGLKVISDDFLPVCGISRKVYPFPLPISVKNIALPILMPLFPGLENRKYRYKDISTAYVNLLPLESMGNNDFKAYPVKHIIFPSYNPDSRLTLIPLSSDEALQLFLNNALLSSGVENAHRFINWFIKIPCYRLEYPQAENAVKEIKSLLAL